MSVEDIYKIKLEKNISTVKNGSPFIALTKAYVDVEILNRHFVGNPCFYVHENNNSNLDMRLSSENFRITTINKAAGAIFFPLKETILKSKLVKYINIEKYGFKFMTYSHSYIFKFMPDYGADIDKLAGKVGIVLANKDCGMSNVLFDRVYLINNCHVTPV